MEGARAPLVFAHALGNDAVEVVCVTDTALNLGRRLKREIDEAKGGMSKTEE